MCGVSLGDGQPVVVLTQKGNDSINCVKDKLTSQHYVLADAIWTITKNSQTGGPTGNVHFVPDGGLSFTVSPGHAALHMMQFALCMSSM